MSGGAGLAPSRRSMSKANASYVMVVLVVEDEFMIRENIVEYFRRAGCLVLEAETGEQAVAMLRRDRPIDVVFTDIRLAGDLNGWDVGEFCREFQGDMAVVYTSGNPIRPGRTVSGSMFFAKPYRAEEIFEACRSLCH